MMVLTKLLGAVLLVCAVSAPSAPAQRSSAPKRIVTLRWYDRFYDTNIRSDQQFRAALQSAAPGGIEYYSEYLETNRFPGDRLSLLLRDYLRQKYAGYKVDVLVTRGSPPLDFVLEHRHELFLNSPIVFATERPVAARLASDSQATGIVYANSHRRTVDLALTLHPGTKRLFVISGTLTKDKAFELIARDELQNYKNSLVTTYWTDLPPDELKARLKNAPKRSIVLYVWQQARNEQGVVLESRDILSRIAPGANAPIYGMSHVNVGLGIIGGYVWTAESLTARLVELTLRVANGAPARDIPVQKAPETPMFDWRQLQRWGVREDRLPPGSVIRFREVTHWEQYSGRIAAAVLVLALQACLIGALLVGRRRARRARKELEEYKEDLERVVRERTAELVEARDHALAANQAKSMFLANMSHELRSPLNAILGFSALVRADAGLPEKHRDDLAIVGSSGEHLLGLIDDVLDMAKIEAGDLVVKTASMDLHNLVQDVLNMLRERALANNLELLMDVSERAPRFIRSDSGKLRQVLTNMVGNALKYTDQGTVTVRLDARPAGGSASLVLILEVEDTGIGIAPEDQTRIFDPFVQAGGPRTGKGAGLGLSISRHFVQLLGGSVRVESAPGRGSLFHIEVPVETAEASEVAPEIVTTEQVLGLEPGQRDYRILIVEDRRENWLLLQRLLQTAGFQARVAEDGAQAVESFKIWRPHFIWMDVRLPVMNGREAARRIRDLDGGRGVKIVAVTASAFAPQREEVLAADFDDFLRKPYRPREIFDCMARHLGVRYMYRAGPQATDGNQPPTLRAQDLAALPVVLRDELERSIVSLDRKWIVRVIGQISEQNGPLGSVLTRLADRLAYTSIYEALERCKG